MSFKKTETETKIKLSNSHDHSNYKANEHHNNTYIYNVTQKKLGIFNANRRNKEIDNIKKNDRNQAYSKKNNDFNMSDEERENSNYGIYIVIDVFLLGIIIGLLGKSIDLIIKNLQNISKIDYKEDIDMYNYFIALSIFMCIYISFLAYYSDYNKLNIVIFFIIFLLQIILLIISSVAKNNIIKDKKNSLIGIFIFIIINSLIILFQSFTYIRMLL